MSENYRDNTVGDTTAGGGTVGGGTVGSCRALCGANGRAVPVRILPDRFIPGRRTSHRANPILDSQERPLIHAVTHPGEGDRSERRANHESELAVLEPRDMTGHP